MKMSAETFQALQDHILGFLSEKCLSEDEVTEHYHDRGWPLERARWDTFHASKFDSRKLYAEGLNDNHIDTALRRIMHHGASA